MATSLEGGSGTSEGVKGAAGGFRLLTSLRGDVLERPAKDLRATRSTFSPASG